MRVDIDQISREYAAQIVKWKSDPILAEQIMSDYRIVSLSEVENWIDKNTNDPNQRLRGIFLNSESGRRIVGVVRLMFIDFESENAEFGIYIGESEFQGLGIGKEALRLITELAFKELKLHKIYLKVNTTNERAIKLYKNFGFLEEGILKEHYFNNSLNKYEDVMKLGLFNSVSK